MPDRRGVSPTTLNFLNVHVPEQFVRRLPSEPIVFGWLVRGVILSMSEGAESNNMESAYDTHEHRYTFSNGRGR